jgi:hypothetical protein
MRRTLDRRTAFGEVRVSYVQFRGQKREIISQPLWDTVSVAAATATSQATFYTIPRGGAAGKTLEDSNMTLAGQLPRPQVYYVKAVSFAVKATVPAATSIPNSETDFAEILDGVAQFVVGAKTMLEAPLYWFVAGFGINVQQLDAGAAVRAVNLTNGLQGMPYRWFLKHRIMIDENENFRIDCSWETAFNSAVAVDLVMVLDGELIRSIQ